MDNYIKILPELNESISKIKEISGNSSDVLINRFLAGGIECALICCEGMFSSQTMGKLVFDPVTKIPVQKNSYELFRYIQKNTLFSADRPAVSDYNTLLPAHCRRCPTVRGIICGIVISGPCIRPPKLAV